MEALKIVSGIHNNKLINDANIKKKVDKIINDIGKTYSDIELCLNRYTDIPYKDSDEYYGDHASRIFGYDRYGRTDTEIRAEVESEMKKTNNDYKSSIIPKKEKSKIFLDTNFKTKGQSHFSKGFLEGFRISLLIQRVLYRLLNAEISDKKLEWENEENYFVWNDIKYIKVYDNVAEEKDEYIFYNQEDKNKIIHHWIKCVENGHFFDIQVYPLDLGCCYGKDEREYENNETLMFSEEYHHKD